MYTELLAIDLPTVVGVASATNFDILRARERVLAQRGRYESAVGAAFPVIAPMAMFESVDGARRATEGNLVNVDFHTFQPSVAVQWVVNPGRVIFDIIAARKRLDAIEKQAEAVEIETLRQAMEQYYELILAQAQVGAARQAVDEAEELLRITKVRSDAGLGVAADELRAEARRAERLQDLALALHRFYERSIGLGLTLRLDPRTTLIPSAERISPVQLVRNDLTIDQLLGIAAQCRPDMAGVRALVDAAHADRGAVFWGAFGPQLQVAYEYGALRSSTSTNRDGIPGNLIVNPTSATGSFTASPLANGFVKEAISRRSQSIEDQTFDFTEQQSFRAGGGWRLSASAFGDLKTADANQRLTIIEAERQLERVRADVVRASQYGQTQDTLIGLANQQVTSAEEALRLTEASLRAGAATTLDVLTAQDAVAQARARYAGAVVRYNQGQVSLLAAVGLLDADAVISPSSDSGSAPDSE
jgi:outer membrane protein TolC